MRATKYKRISSSGMLAAFAGIAFLCSCKEFHFNDQKKMNALARVHDKYLYRYEIANLVPPDASPKDSAMIVKSFIEDWIKQNIVLYLAEQNLVDEQKNVERQLQEYRNSLLTHAYEQELVRQRLDTTVATEEIEKYYTENSKNFVLKNNIIKSIFLRVPKKAPKLDKLKAWALSNSDKDRQLLEEYCFHYAKDYSLNDANWILFDDLLKRVPIKTYDKEEFLRNNRFIEISDSASIYYVKIADFQVKESTSPLSFEKENIRELIINKRKLLLIQEMQQNAFQQALKNNEFEIYP